MKDELTLDWFLASGRKLVGGDAYFDTNTNKNIVVGIDVSDTVANKACTEDKCRVIDSFNHNRYDIEELIKEQDEGSEDNIFEEGYYLNTEANQLAMFADGYEWFSGAQEVLHLDKEYLKISGDMKIAWDFEIESGLKAKEKYISKTQPKLYTKEMHDNNAPINVGMMFIHDSLKDHDNPCEVIGLCIDSGGDEHVTYETKSNIVLMDNYGNIKIKPTPKTHKEKLEDQHKELYIMLTENSALSSKAASEVFNKLKLSQEKGLLAEIPKGLEG